MTDRFFTKSPTGQTLKLFVQPFAVGLDVNRILLQRVDLFQVFLESFFPALPVIELLLFFWEFFHWSEFSLSMSPAFP
jgi:hypothetical protein